ncbi:hypothetical protein U1P98_01100 [Lysinibacillus irui]|uniref:SMODS and SLOG-associating 2TM effector domain-containing protein n=1 Tax=Lysinibacillus irui TaxID=2998077 RepID=A0ABU5NFS2_9BACI|nr:hypothetical protein [Lysinibacillus irui]MEA0554183.1 hypothetical protein [Lysinibacillus irui]MEA0974875.1 hypothetical protein [Lysinibacillus irui]MEA1041029.1 hypothetical protein [Lysinibacillus irui]
MDKSSLDRIEKFCDKQKSTIRRTHRDFMIRRFLESYFNQISEREKKQRKSLTESEKESIREAFLDENNLQNMLIAADDFYETLEAQYESNFNKKNGGGFLKNVFASITGSFVYSILLIIIFWVAKDQLATWLSSLAK